jgi:hypothetical protein
MATRTRTRTAHQVLADLRNVTDALTAADEDATTLRDRRLALYREARAAGIPVAVIASTAGVGSPAISNALARADGVR